MILCVSSRQAFPRLYDDEKRTPFDACKWCEENCLGKDKSENMAKACDEECKRHCQKIHRRFFRPIFKDFE
ncbi:hypothetical protein ABFA07_003057 [Porites harrisoni]